MSPEPPTHVARPFRLLLLCVTLGLALSLAAADGAFGIIHDTDAEPCWSWRADGSDNGVDIAHDVAMTSKATWVAGQLSNTYNGLDASLIRIPRGNEFGLHMGYWNSRAGRDDVNYDVAARGSYVYTSGTSRASGGDLDLVIVRWSSTGVLKWAKRWAGAAKGDDVALDVAIDRRGNGLVCGYTTGVNGRDWVVVKYSRAGRRLWTWKYDGPAHADDTPFEMTVDGSGNTYVTGSSQVTATASAAYTVKLSSAGRRLWARKYRGPSAGATVATALAPRPKGGVYVGGRTWVAGRNNDMFVLQYDARGRRKVFELFDGAGGDVQQQLNDLAVASNGWIIGVGSEGLAGSADAARVLWKTSGFIQSSEVGGFIGDDWWQAVAADSVGGLYATGPRYSPSGTVAIQTERWSIYTNGGRWAHAEGADPMLRKVTAIAAYGTSAAVVGLDYRPATGGDQMIDAWRY